MTHKNLGTLPSTSWRNSVCSCCLFGEPTEIAKSTNQGGWGLGRVGTAAQRQLQQHGCNCSNLLSLCENQRIDLNSRRIPSFFCPSHLFPPCPFGPPKALWLVHLSSCYCYGYRSWEGPCAFQGFVEISIIIRDPTWSQNPFLDRLGNGSRSCFVGFRCFGNTSCSFQISFCIHLHACSFHFAFISFHSRSFHIPFIGIIT